MSNEMQHILRFFDEHHQRIFRISYLALVLPIFLLTIIPLLCPIFLQLPNADVVEFQLRKSNAVIDIGYYSICLDHPDLSLKNPFNHSYLHGCIGTTNRHADGKTLARQWGKVASAGPEIYDRLVDDFSMALKLQRDAFYSGLVIAAFVLWILGIGLFVTASYIEGSRKTWVLRVYKGMGVVASILLVAASVATTAAVYAVIEYIHFSNPGAFSGRMGAILAVQWAAAGAMGVHALLAFAVAREVEDGSEGSIRLEN